MKKEIIVESPWRQENFGWAYSYQLLQRPAVPYIRGTIRECLEYREKMLWPYQEVGRKEFWFYDNQNITHTWCFGVVGHDDYGPKYGFEWFPGLVLDMWESHNLKIKVETREPILFPFSDNNFGWGYSFRITKSGSVEVIETGFPRVSGTIHECQEYREKDPLYASLKKLGCEFEGIWFYRGKRILETLSLMGKSRRSDLRREGETIEEWERRNKITKYEWTFARGLMLNNNLWVQDDILIVILED